jgi:hypothetical protein
VEAADIELPACRYDSLSDFIQSHGAVRLLFFASGGVPIEVALYAIERIGG